VQALLATINERFCESWKAAGFVLEPTAVGKIRFEVDFSKGDGGGKGDGGSDEDSDEDSDDDSDEDSDEDSDDDSDDDDEGGGLPLDPMQMLEAIRALMEALERFFRPIRKSAPVTLFPLPTAPRQRAASRSRWPAVDQIIPCLRPPFVL